MTEARNDASNDLAVTVLTDENMSPCSAIPRWNHELLGMPEGEDNIGSAPIESIDFFVAACLWAYGRRNGPHQCRPDWRQD
jgi:hypothetical protein